MHDLDILCLGEPLVEFNQRSDGAFAMGFGGDVSNVAISAARQGASVGLISRVGTDLFGISLRSLWEREGVDASFISFVDDAETGLYLVTHDDEGHHFHYRRQGSAASMLGSSDLSEIAISQANVLYASGISLAVSASMRDATIAATTIANEHGNLVAFDPNFRTALWPLDEAREITHSTMRHCDIALPGLCDARQLSGLNSPQDIVAFYHDLGAGIVALTLGEAGVLLSQDGNCHQIPGHAVDAIDATGAGDCFNGAFLAEYCRSRNAIRAAERANLAAALSTTGYGAVDPIPTEEDLKAFDGAESTKPV